MVKQDKSFLFLTQLAGFPGVCLETLSAKASLPQEHFSYGGKNGQAITGSPCHHVEDASGSLGPYGTLHFCSLTWKIVHASLCMSLPSCYCPSVLGWITSSISAAAKGHNCVGPCCLEKIIADISLPGLGLHPGSPTAPPALRVVSRSSRQCQEHVMDSHAA